jgi:catechol 2,3-dioxygenase-like lactoylglutathione lyase family enzyme
MTVSIENIDHLVLNVADAKASADWYVRVLGMRLEIVKGRTVLWFGRQKIHLRPIFSSQDEWFTAAHAAAGSDDLCFATTSRIEQILEHLKSCEVKIEVGPVERDGALGLMTSVYCRDPDGSLVEISTYNSHE